MGEVGVAVRGLHKRYGPTAALDGMGFSVGPGRVTGFVGPNGAGKSTTMRVVLGLDTADEGTALIGGLPYRSLRRPMTHIGALLDAAALQPSRRARNHLLWMARSQGIGARRVDEVIDRVGLATVAGRRAGGFSLGMRQRLGIAAALLGDPGVLMMDEPFNGMDPEGIIWLRGLLRALAGEGRAVLISSHLMSELQDTATHVVVVGRGRVVADTSVAELLAAASAGGRVTLRAAQPERAATVLGAAGGTAVPAGPGTLSVSGLSAEDIVAHLTRQGVPFSEVAAHRATLEDAYLRLTRDATEFTGADAVGGTRTSGGTETGERA
ncbi:ABC-2 type transport system ATP-binding protein [Actinacidiphila yanglinensis]|uniref:ABC-2 type transport system ATP-binding protein n=1 Tax=Actinacidiphila yanglinensis TaxID=310779 RepID=A0A1H5VPI3_9ACTN|nr:ATP-binding cassette domain-containing protein [Actinacidiphila yanglinensis]SEF88427.1 ABC-2 type transport system ATP-binding protein [Actinacidiphila yanglinensis]